MLARNWVNWRWSEFDHIEHWVEAFHGRREGQAVSICPDVAFHCERSKAVVREFLGWSGGVNVTGIKVDLVASDVDRGWSPSLVVVPCHVILCLG